MTNRIIIGDALTELRKLEAESVQMCVTSPPYWGLRDYGADGQLGLEKTPEEYVLKMVEIFREVKRVLKKDGTLWLNLGDSYMGSGQDSGKIPGQQAQWITGNRKVGEAHPYEKPPTTLKHSTLKSKDQCFIPHRVAMALQADGWWCRDTIIWAKPNPMPESVTDRCTKSHEYIFLLSKSADYYCNMEAIAEPVKEVSLKRAEYGWNCDRPSTKNASMGGKGIHTEKMGTRFVNPEGRNRRSVWTINTEPYPEAHFAVFPSTIPSLCIQAGSRPGDVVLDPFGGSGTTGQVAKQLSRDFILIELNAKYLPLINRRLSQESLNL